MDPFAVLGAAQCAIGVLTTCYNIYKRIQGADEKIDDAGTEIETNLSFLREHFSKPRAELSPETLKRVNTRLRNIEEAAKEAKGILELWEAHNSKWLYMKAFQVGPFPGRLEDLSDKIEKNIERLRREFSGLAGGMAGTNNHAAVIHGAPPSGPTGRPPSVGFQPSLPSRLSDPYTVSGNFNNPVPLLSSSAPPGTSAPGWSGMSGPSQPLNPLAQPFTRNLNVQLNNQPPHSAHSRPPLHHSSTTVPLVMPPHQQPNAPSQNAPPPGYQHQPVGNSSSYQQPPPQPGIPSTQSLPPNGSNPLYSSGNVHGYATAQPPPPYGVPVPSTRIANLAPPRPAANQPPQGTSHSSSNIPGKPQNYQNQPPQRQPHLGNPPTQPSHQPQASHGTGQGMRVPPPPQRHQGSQNAHLQILNNSQWATGSAQASKQPQVPGTGHILAPPATTLPQGFQKPQTQMANTGQYGGFTQSSKQHQVPQTGYMPAPPAVKQSQGLQTTQFSNNAQLGGNSAQSARQPQVPGAGHVSAPPVPIHPSGQGPIRPSRQGPIHPPGQGPIRPPGQGPIRPPGQGPIRPPGQGPIRPPGQGPIRPQTSHPLPNSGIAGVSQHHTGPATYVPGGMSNIPNTSTRSSTQAQSNPTGWVGNTNNAPGHLPSAIGGSTAARYQNSFPGMPGNGLQPGFQ